MKVLKPALFLAVVFGGCCSVATAQLRVVQLRTEYLTNPTCIDALHPRLSWINLPSSPTVKNEAQTAYQVCVASSKAVLLKGKADVWDSKKVKSAESHLVPFGGKVESGKDYWWRVRTWNQKDKPSEWSEPACWGMGLLNASDWKAQWIGASFDGPAPLFRKAFNVTKPVRQAKVFICGLGYFELYANGRRVGNDCLVPNFTNYTGRTGLDKDRVPLDSKFRAYRVLYLSYDVTAGLQQGRNALGVVLGNGFYNCDETWTSPFGKPILLCQLQLQYVDGSSETVVSDGSWLTKESAIVKDGVYAGEVYDARKETPDWASADCREQGWQPAVAAQKPEGELTAQASPADKITERLKPVSFKKLDDGSCEVDFGKEISGWIRVQDMQGKAGDTLSVKYVCECPLGVHHYILNGSGKESYAPRFTWYVFRKAVLKGVSGGLDASQLTAEAVNTDVPVAARFETSNPLFNQINKIWQRSQLDNMHGCIACDCPHRERSPYTGDGEIACPTVMHNFDAAAFYQKWIRDMRDCQDVNTGYEPNGAPWQPGCGGGVAWGAAMSIMPWEFYRMYGDREQLMINYGPMKQQTDYMLNWLTKDGTMLQQRVTPGTDKLCEWLNLGDWSPAYGMPDKEIVHTFFLWQCLTNTAKAAKALGREDDVKHYEDLAVKVRDAFHKKFYNAAAKSYGDFGSNIYALRMGVPAEVKQDVVRTLRSEIMDKYKGHINTGFVAARYFFEVLAENGLNDVAYTVMNKTDFPGFGNWIRQGATTTWEQWDGKNSRNHPMFGGALMWFYKNLAGIQPDETQPGFRNFFVKPELTDSLNRVYYSIITPYGEVSSNIVKSPQGWDVKVTVPVGSHAVVILPGLIKLVGQGTYVFNVK